MVVVKAATRFEETEEKSLEFGKRRGAGERQTELTVQVDALVILLRLACSRSLGQEIQGCKAMKKMSSNNSTV